jgi:hypothetical protein
MTSRALKLHVWSRTEGRGESPVMGRGSQSPHVHMEFVGQNLKWQLIMRWPLRPRNHPS